MLEYSIALVLVAIVSHGVMKGFVQFQRQQALIRAWSELQQTGRLVVGVLLERFCLGRFESGAGGAHIDWQKHRSVGGVVLHLTHCQESVCRPMKLFVVANKGLYQRIGSDRRQRLIAGIQSMNIIGSNIIMTICSHQTIPFLTNKKKRLWVPYYLQHHLCADWQLVMQS